MQYTSDVNGITLSSTTIQKKKCFTIFNVILKRNRKYMEGVSVFATENLVAK